MRTVYSVYNEFFRGATKVRMGYSSKQRTARGLGNMGRGRSGRPSHGILWEEDNTGGGSQHRERKTPGKRRRGREKGNLSLDQRENKNELPNPGPLDVSIWCRFGDDALE